MEYKPGQKVRIDWPDGTSATGFVSGYPSTAIWIAGSTRALMIPGAESEMNATVTILEGEK